MILEMLLNNTGKERKPYTPFSVEHILYIFHFIIILKFPFLLFFLKKTLDISIDIYIRWTDVNIPEGENLHSYSTWTCK
jgi:hypothetical protein